MVEYATLAPDILSVADMVPEPQIVTELRTVAAEVCRDTEVWKDTAEVTSVEGQLDYALPKVGPRNERGVLIDPMTAGVPHRLQQASFDQAALRLATQLQIARWKPDWRNTGEQFRGTPLYAIQGITAQTVSLYYTPDAAAANKTARFTVTLVPLTGSVGLPEDVMGEVRDVLVLGCLQRLMAMPRRPWSNRASSEYYARQYRFKRNAVRVRASHDFTHGPLVAELRPWV